MSILTTAGMWLRALTQRDNVEQELDREMQFHLDMEIEQNVRNGMSVVEARRQALLAFGGVERHKEATRDERGTRWIDDFASDSRHAWRFFSSRPVFTFAAVITIAIGIGAATAVYSLANWVLLRPVPGVWASREVMRIDLHRISDTTKKWVSPSGISYPNLRDVEAATPALTGMAASAYPSVHLAGDNVPAQSTSAEAIVGDYFGILGVKAQVGRLFHESEWASKTETRVAVLSDVLWRSQFGADPGIVGRQIRLNGATFDVIGVAGPRFRGINRVGNTDLWVPGSAYATLRHFQVPLESRGSRFFFDFIGRLVPGATATTAQEQIRSALARLAVAYPEDNAILETTLAHVAPDLGIVSYGRDTVASTMRLLGIVVTIVLLISCANAANLLLLRGIQRRGETAVRRALGASGGRLVRQHFTEGLLLSLLACIVGIGLSFGFRAVMREQAVAGFPSLRDMPFDPRILVFAIGLSLLVGVLFSLIPAIVAIRSDFLSQLKEAARAASGSGLALRRILTVVQISAATALVVVGLLLGRTLFAFARVDVGLKVDGLISFYVDPSLQGYSRERMDTFRAQLAATLASTPGFEASTLASHAPFWGGSMRADLRPVDYAGSDWPVDAIEYHVDASYFKTLNIPVLAGRMPVAHSIDTANGARPIQQVVVNRSLARQLFGDRDPLGRTIIRRIYKGTTRHVVVGVVGDVRVTSLRARPDLIMYAPLGSGDYPSNAMIAIVRTSLGATEAERVARAAVARVDPSVPVGRTQLLSVGIQRSIVAERLFGRLVSLLALLSAALTAAGLYGIVAYSVTERTREIGLRMALGATRRRVIALVGRQALALVVVGIAVGIGAAVWLSRLLASKLFGVTPLDPITYITGALVLLVIGAIAASVPARSATRVNPVDALRHS